MPLSSFAGLRVLGYGPDMTMERGERIEVEDGPFGAYVTLVTGRADADIVVRPAAGHAFESSFHPVSSTPDAAAVSGRQTLDFLARTLGC